MRNIILLVLLFFVLSSLEVLAADWPMDAGNAQRTGYTTEDPLTPWTFSWSFNGPDSSGGAGGHIYNAPREARTVTGGGKIYVPAGSKGLYGLDVVTGQVSWNVTSTNFNASPAYDANTGSLLAGGTDGKIYKISASSGSVIATYSAGSPINKAALLAGSFVYVVTDSGQLHKVNIGTMVKEWVYSANSAVATPPSYSASRDVVVFATEDLYVHAVANANGSLKWRVKPSQNAAGFPNQFDGSWPVVADNHGVVFVRMRLDHNSGLWGGPGPNGMYPNTNTETRSFLSSHPQLQNLFALSLDSGLVSFIPAVGYGGVESLVNGAAYLDVGPVPVVKVTPDGHEVAYMFFRNGSNAPPDGRWDSHVGEMVLDSNTVSGLSAGDLRFIDFPNGQVYVTDEQTPLTLGGNTILHAHWGASESVRIIDRSSSLGLTYTTPIKTQVNPVIIRRMTPCGDFNASTHFTSCGLALLNDGRYWSGPGFWTYWNVMDPPTPNRGAYSEGILPRYTYASNGYLIVEGNGGEILAFKHNGAGNVTSGPTSTPVPKSGDANGDGKVDGLDYVIWLTNYNTQVSGGNTKGDFDGSRKVDGLDYVIWLTNYGK